MIVVVFISYPIHSPIPPPCPSNQVPIPDHIDLYHLDCEAEPSDRTALEAVIDHLKNEMERLEAMEQAIMEEVGGEGVGGVEDGARSVTSRVG